jgi:hypothetical protein
MASARIERIMGGSGAGPKQLGVKQISKCLKLGLRQTHRPTTALNWHINWNKNEESHSRPIGYGG